MKHSLTLATILVMSVASCKKTVSQDEVERITVESADILH